MAQRTAPVALFPFSVVRAIVKRWKSNLAIWFVLAFAGCAFVHRLPNVFRSESTILVEQQKIPEQLVASTVQVDLQDRLATLTQKILSATQLQKIIEKHNLYAEMRPASSLEDVVERMRLDIDVKAEKGWSRQKPGAFHIAYKGSDPQLTANITNELASLFIEENIKAREVQATGTSEFLNNQLEDARKRLLEQEAKLADFKQRNAGQLPGQENALMMALTQLQTQATANNESLNRAQASKEMLEAELRSAESGMQRMTAASTEQNASAAGPGGAPQPGAAAGNPEQPGQAPAIKRSEQLQIALEQLQQRYTDQHPQVRAVRAELERQKAQEAKDAREAAAAKIAKASATAKDQIASASAPGPGTPATPAPVRVSPQTAVMLEQQKERMDHLQAELSTVNLEIQNRIAERDRINTELAGHQARLEKLPLREQEMISVTRDYEISKRRYEGLLGGSFTANTAEDMEKLQKAERFTILDAGTVPEKPYSPNRTLFYPAVALGSLLFTLALSVYSEARKNVILGEWELPKDVWLLARIPKVELADRPIPAIVSESKPADV